MTSNGEWLQTKTKTVLFATDLGENAGVGLRYAAAIARRFNAELILFYAFQFGPRSVNVELVSHVPSRERTDAETLMREFSTRIKEPGLIFRTIVVEGDIPDAVQKAITTYNVDVLVMGTKVIHKGASHLILGSKTETLMLGSTCPVITIGPLVGTAASMELSFKKIIYISELAVESAAAAPFVEALADSYKADIALYQLPREEDRTDPARLLQLAVDYCTVLSSIQPAVRQDWCNPDYQLTRVRNDEDIEKLLAEHSALVVLGVHPSSFLGRHLHTSLSYRLLGKTLLPIVTIPWKEDALPFTG